MDIEREWSRDPGWFAGLEHADQIRLLAHWRIRHAPPKKPKKRRK